MLQSISPGKAGNLFRAQSQAQKEQEEGPITQVARLRSLTRGPKGADLLLASVRVAIAHVAGWQSKAVRHPSRRGFALQSAK